jgi:hypothetical protein
MFLGLITIFAEQHKLRNSTSRDCLSVSLSIYASTALVGLGHFNSFLIYTQSVGLLGQGISPSQGRYLHTE